MELYTYVYYIDIILVGVRLVLYWFYISIIFTLYWYCLAIALVLY